MNSYLHVRVELDLFSSNSEGKGYWRLLHDLTTGCDSSRRDRHWFRCELSGGLQDYRIGRVLERKCCAYVDHRS